MQHSILDYTIDYLGADGRKRGQEICTLSTHRDGRRTLRARSEIFDSEVLRDVIYTVTADFVPIDALVRLTLKDAFVGAGLFVFAPDQATCRSITVADGPIEERVALEAPAVSFISHAVAGDVWHGAGIARDRGDVAQPLPSILSASPMHNGSTGPSLGRWPLQARFLGQEAVETPAGRFAAERIRYEEPDGSLFLDTWCTADSDRVMLRMYYPPYESSYLLTSLRRSLPG